MEKLFTLLVLGLSMTALVSCGGNTEMNLHTPAIADEIEAPKEEDPIPVMKFVRRHINNAADLNKIRKEYNFSDKASPSHRVLITMNRKEFRFFRVGDTIVVPEVNSQKVEDYSIFPGIYPEAKNIPKLIVLSNKYQCYACYENGKLVRYAATNTGKERTQTYPGRYQTNWKKRIHRSSLDSHWVMPYNVNFHLQAGNAFHQFTMPGRPVSHSCARQFMHDAQWLYDWIDLSKFDENRTVTQQGTTVLVLDVFDFTRPKFGPWLDLADNKSADIHLPADPTNYELPFIPINQIPQGARGALKDKNRHIHAEDTLRARGWLRPGVKLTSSVNFNAIRKRKRAAEEKKKAEAEAAKANINQN